MEFCPPPPASSPTTPLVTPSDTKQTKTTALVKIGIRACAPLHLICVDLRLLAEYSGKCCSNRHSWLRSCLGGSTVTRALLWFERTARQKGPLGAAVSTFPATWGKHLCLSPAPSPKEPWPYLSWNCTKGLWSKPGPVGSELPFCLPFISRWRFQLPLISVAPQQWV